MGSFSKEVIADLVAGTLPWPQTRRVMSAYKDDDRFFKYVAVLQDRVEWKDPILLPVSDHLFICQSGDERVTKCECGHSFGDYRKNWKLNAHIIVRDTEESLREPQQRPSRSGMDGDPGIHLPRVRHASRSRSRGSRLPDRP